MDITRIPFTTRSDLVLSLGSTPGRRFSTNSCSPVDKLTFLAQTGGVGTEELASSGHRPLAIPIRAIDILRRATVAARAFRMSCSVRDVQNTRTVILHEAPSSLVHFAMVRGLYLAGSTVLSLGRGSTLRHVTETIPRFAPQQLVTYPSYATFLDTVARDCDVQLSFKDLFLWGEVGGSVRPVRDRLSNAFSAKVHDIYAMQEFGVLAAECKAGKGLHGFEDQFLYEVIDPESGEVLEDGRPGELVVTDLHRTAFPLVRYRTGDITSISRSRCSCGRTHLRLMGIKGRLTDAIVGDDGRTAYPADMVDMLEGNPHLTGVYRYVPGMGTIIETKENKQMADHYLGRFGRPPGTVSFERVLPRFPHRTEYMVGPRYERLLKEQIGRER